MKDCGEADDPKYFDLEEADSDVRHYRSLMQSGEDMWGRKYDGPDDPEEADDYETDDAEEDDAEADTDFDDNSYTYQHPEYPKTLEMENLWVGEELCKIPKRRGSRLPRCATILRTAITRWMPTSFGQSFSTTCSRYVNKLHAIWTMWIGMSGRRTKWSSRRQPYTRA